MKYILTPLILLIILFEFPQLFKTNHKKSDFKDKVKIDSLISTLSLRERIAQMIVIPCESFYEEGKDFNDVFELIKNEHIGGVIFLRGRSDVEVKMVNKFQQESTIPLLISQDFEYGTGMRLEDGSIFPGNMALGATQDENLAYSLGYEIAKESRALGVYQVYAPVLDVNNNPKNPIINIRSFGEDPILVSQLGVSFIRGLQNGGVIATGKHFPGHGDTEIDSHSSLPIINLNRDRLEKVELFPFQEAIKNGVKSVMVAHLIVPALDNSYLPSSLSYNIITELLQKQMGFTGLIVTDAMNMSAITNTYSNESAAVMAAMAGNDILLMIPQPTKAIDAIESAVKNGTISEERINHSVRKILQAKLSLGLFESKLVDEQNVKQIINSPDAVRLSQKIAELSITLVKNSSGNIPLGRRMIAREKCMIISLNDGKATYNNQYFIDNFSSKTEEYFGPAKIYDITGEVKNKKEIIEASQKFTYVVVPMFSKVKIKSGTIDIPNSQKELLKALISKGKQVFIISFGNPYLLSEFEEVDSYIATYSDCKASIDAVIKAMFGEIPFRGKLPITISEKYKLGYGITTP
ncbi:MAG: glycoside hydrolase family 3 N-terminal domain-containing protein [Ignavibacteria bacterium]